MADSKVFDAQDVLLCELCECSTAIEWKCLDCELFMCDKCKQKIHSKIKATEYHNTILIKDIVSEEHIQRKAGKNQRVFCKAHAEHFYCLYCKTCCALVCQDCISSAHSKHAFESIETIIAESTTTLLDCRYIVEDDLCKIYTENANKIDGLQQNYNEQCNEAITKIKQQEKKIKEAMETAVENVLKTVEKKKQYFDARLSMERESNGRFHVLTQQTTKAISDALASNNPETLLNAAKEVLGDLETIETPFIKPCNEKLVFESSAINHVLMGEMIGTLQGFEVDDKVLILKKAGTYSIRYNSIASVKTTKDNHFYILDNDVYSSKKTIGYIAADLKRKQFKTTQNYCEIDACDFALTRSGDLLLYLVDSSDIKQLLTDGTLKTHTSFHPLIVRGLHISKYGEIIVGLRENGPLFPINEDSIRRVVVLDSDGNSRKIYEYNKKGERLFSVPGKFATDSVRNIYVADDLESENSRIICLSAYKSIKWTYRGPPKSEFEVCDMITTAHGNLIVLTETDMYILSSNGEVIKTYNCKVDLKICDPGCLDIDDQMNLWVGGSSVVDENRQILNKFTFPGF